MTTVNSPHTSSHRESRPHKQLSFSSTFSILCSVWSGARMPQNCQDVIDRKKSGKSTALGRRLKSFFHLLFKLTKCVQNESLDTRVSALPSLCSHTQPHSGRIWDFGCPWIHVRYKLSIYVWERKGRECLWIWLHGAKFYGPSRLFKEFPYSKPLFFGTVSQITARWCQGCLFSTAFQTTQIDLEKCS